MAHRAARNCVFAERRAATPVLLVSPPWCTQSPALFARIPCATTATREHPYNKETKVEGGADRGGRDTNPLTDRCNGSSTFYRFRTNRSMLNERSGIENWRWWRFVLASVLEESTKNRRAVSGKSTNLRSFVYRLLSQFDSIIIFCASTSTSIPFC